MHPQTALPYPFNDANDLYRSIINDPASRNSSQVIGKLNSIGLTQVQDYEQVYARKLNPTDYTYNPQVGFHFPEPDLQPNDVLGVLFSIVTTERSTRWVNFPRIFHPIPRWDLIRVHKKYFI